MTSLYSFRISLFTYTYCVQSAFPDFRHCQYDTKCSVEKGKEKQTSFKFSNVIGKESHQHLSDNVVQSKRYLKRYHFI